MRTVYITDAAIISVLFRSAKAIGAIIDQEHINLEIIRTLSDGEIAAMQRGLDEFRSLMAEVTKLHCEHR
jgi:hypothetical protein